MSETKPPDSLEKIHLFAYLSEDEFGSGVIGIKQALVPAGYIPLVSIDASKLNTADLVEQLHQMANIYGKTIRLCEFKFDRIIKEIKPEARP